MQRFLKLTNSTSHNIFFQLPKETVVVACKKTPLEIGSQSQRWLNWLVNTCTLGYGVMSSVMIVAFLQLWTVLHFLFFFVTRDKIGWYRQNAKIQILQLNRVCNTTQSHSTRAYCSEVSPSSNPHCFYHWYFLLVNINDLLLTEPEN